MTFAIQNAKLEKIFMFCPMNIQEKSLIVFDFDGTLNASKVPIDTEIKDLLTQLLEKKMVAIISGSGFDYYKLNILDVLECPDDLLKKLFLFPTSSTRFYRFEGEWKQIYADEIPQEERQMIKDAFEKAYRDIGYTHPPQVFGEIVEDRGTQITFSALGQQAPLELKQQWRATQDRRPELIEALKKYLPEFEIKMPGVTSIDITRKGIDKAYGVEQMRDNLGIPISEMVFVGDALYEGGNDHAVVRTGIDTFAVENPEDTKKLLRGWLAQL